MFILHEPAVPYLFYYMTLLLSPISTYATCDAIATVWKQFVICHNVKGVAKLHSLQSSCFPTIAIASQIAYVEMGLLVMCNLDMYGSNVYISVLRINSWSFLKDVRHLECCLINCHYDVTEHIVSQYKKSEFLEKN